MICNTYIQFFKTVAEPSRVELLYHLKKDMLYVGDLMKKTGKEQSAISHNLKKLKEKGFVSSSKEGKHRRYALTKEGRLLFQSIDTYIQKYFHKECKCKR